MCTKHYVELAAVMHFIRILRKRQRLEKKGSNYRITENRKHLQDRINNKIIINYLVINAFAAISNFIT